MAFTNSLGQEQVGLVSSFWELSPVGVSIKYAWFLVNGYMKRLRKGIEPLTNGLRVGARNAEVFANVYHCKKTIDERQRMVNKRILISCFFTIINICNSFMIVLLNMGLAGLFWDLFFLFLGTLLAYN